MSSSRESLKSYFREGALPKEEHFEELINSMLHMQDEGFRKTVAHGVEISAPIGHEALLSFYRSQMPEEPIWALGFSNSDQLLIQSRNSSAQQGGPSQPTKRPPLLNLDLQQRVGIGCESPQAELDVHGCMRSQARQGSFGLPRSQPLLANGKWQNLLENLQGCQAFEIMAGAGHSGQGRFGLLHAIAINTYNPTLGIFNFLNRKRGIRATHGYYSGRCDRIQLRWVGNSGRNAKYGLQIRTGCDYGKDFEIIAQVTQLWNDPHMRAGQPI